jgi:hypothetical protein
MRDVYEVLREKEIRLEQLARELKALRLAAPLLAMVQIPDQSSRMCQILRGSRMHRGFAQKDQAAKDACLSRRRVTSERRSQMK